MRVARGQLPMGLGHFGQGIGRHHPDLDEALAGLLDQVETGLGPDLVTRVRPGSRAEYPNAECQASLGGRQGGDPAAVGHQLE